MASTSLAGFKYIGQYETAVAALREHAPGLAPALSRRVVCGGYGSGRGWWSSLGGAGVPS